MTDDTEKTDASSLIQSTGSRLFRWLRLPKVDYVDWHKVAPNASPGCWKQWFSINRYWGGKLIYVEIRHHSFQFDFRRAGSMPVRATIIFNT